jgi:hypothetical protein
MLLAAAYTYYRNPSTPPGDDNEDNDNNNNADDDKSVDGMSRTCTNSSQKSQSVYQRLDDTGASHG